MINILDREILRKSIHMAGMLIPGIYYFIDRGTAIFWLSLIVVVMIQLEWMRLKGYIQYPNILLRTHETHQTAGYVFFLAAALIVIVLFPKNVAIIAMTMAVVGDTSSGITGAIWGTDTDVRRTGLPLKPLPVLLVMFLVCTVSGYLVMLTLKPITLFSIIVGALGATLADGVPWRIRGHILDDNLTIPLVSALLIFMGSA